MTFGEKLVRLRKIKGITQDEFAAIVGVSRQAVYKWENEKSYPEVLKLLEIKNVFNISIDDLLDENFEIELPKKKRKKRISDQRKKEIEEEVEKELLLTNGEIAVEKKEEKEETVAKEPKIEVAPEKEKESQATEKKVGFFGRLFGKR